MSEEFKTRKFKTPDGRTIHTFDGKFHNWDGPAVKYPEAERKKDEYYIYGNPFSKEAWLEARRDRNGVPPDKNPQVKSRF